ncbi:band 7 protein [Subtercola boreus]|uniref:Band 7 protein n=1 Tax=Subtercola boreus TaxID=120213 RepID=A0A3E0VHF0_9MICO|nr:SPFH domain-containing protein [Subtercola boreus]RFA09065.1 band 7 protein [Subtercola boreus]TQL53933.1 regulator of protease activity HflC (stomatin/prohibitin superfamily) [Subtercola boreus]
MAKVPRSTTEEPVPVGHDGVRVDITESTAASLPGGAGLALCALLLLVGMIILTLFTRAAEGFVFLLVAGILLVATSFVVVQPGQTKVVQFFGRYIGTVRRTGLSVVVPLSTRRNVSVRVRNFETSRLKVNDADGSPVEIAAIVVWQVADTSKATYAVDNYVDFVSVQAESALRHIATTHPYDGSESGGTSLRGSTDQVADELAHEVAVRVSLAGVEIIEVRISHLAYAAEIAQAMLRRQQANAVVAARKRIVEGAVGMVGMALTELREQNIVELDSRATATMVGNLMVVLCSDQPASPVITTGTIPEK